MNKTLATFALALVLALGVACGSSDDEDAAAPLADVSQFPTPSRSLQAAQTEPTQAAPVTAAQAQPGESTSEAAEPEPMTREELEELQRRMQSGDLSEEEMREAIQRLRAQFGGGQGGQGGPGGFGPGGFGGGSQAVGSIDSISGNAMTVATELAKVPVRVGDDAIISITSVLEPSELTEGEQVMVVSERVGGQSLARAITILPEGQGRFGGGRAGPGGGARALGGLTGPAGQGGAAGAAGQQGVTALFGEISDVGDDGLTLETQQGPLPITIDEETIIVQTLQGDVSDLEEGMSVRAIGPENDNGEIDARSVVVIPEGLQGIPGFGGAGRPGSGVGLGNSP